MRGNRLGRLFGRVMRREDYSVVAIERRRKKWRTEEEVVECDMTTAGVRVNDVGDRIK